MKKLSLRDISVFSMLGALMFATTYVMKALPNIHLLALFIVTFTRVYRVRALIPIYIYVMWEGIYQGFTPWWIPYLYIWTFLWAITMLLPKKMPKYIEPVAYCIVGGISGLTFGTLWAPSQAIIFGMSAKAAVTWIISGLPFDITHGISNICMCTLCVPLIRVLNRLEKNNLTT